MKKIYYSKMVTMPPWVTRRDALNGDDEQFRVVEKDDIEGGI